jgi:signal transduction histidine kinase
MRFDGPTQCGVHDDYVESRIREKIEDYKRYSFDEKKSRALAIFFDLSQEFQARDRFYETLILILKVIFELDSAMYVLEDEETFVLASCSSAYSNNPRITRSWDDDMGSETVRRGKRLYIPIRCNPEFNDMLPFPPPDNIIGMLVVIMPQELESDMLLFLEKYANRVGFQLHNRILRDRSREHLDFIRNLVEDIGHNVIVPNIYFKLYFNRLRRRIDSLSDLRDEAEAADNECCRRIAKKLDRMHGGLREQYEEIYRHYVQTSMFLETLLRRRHFEEGRYVLEKRPCNLMRQVIEPQLERYLERMAERDIRVDLSFGGAPDQAVRMYMDVGLISQVFANLFSNAVKYTGKVELPDGRRGKFVSYGWRILKDYFGQGASAIRMFVFTTGEPPNVDDPMELFEPGFRGSDTAAEQGSGHGLYFVRQVVELHRGEVGLKVHPEGNEIFIILPFQVEPERSGDGRKCDL